MRILKPLLFLAIWIGLILLFSGNIQPDLRSDGGYEPCNESGHPLWIDC